VGVWWSGSWRAGDQGSFEAAAELEELGYSALWSSGGFESTLSPHFARLVAATARVKVVSGIVSIWTTDPDQIASEVDELERLHPGRFVLGLGASHSMIVENYARPYSHMVEYLDGLDGKGPTVANDRRVLAALGPRMLRLAAERSAGAHPYFVPVEHTRRAREVLGADSLLAPEVTVVLERDPAAAREAARAFTTGYLALENYANNLRSLGFEEDDLTGGGSDRLVDAVVGWGDAGRIAGRVAEHFEAGADHVCVQVLAASDSFPLDTYRELAPALMEI
jgi:probable F420-dependent oxidoreductase